MLATKPLTGGEGGRQATATSGLPLQRLSVLAAGFKRARLSWFIFALGCSGKRRSCWASTSIENWRVRS